MEILFVIYYIASVFVTSTFFWDLYDTEPFDFVGLAIGLLFGVVFCPFILLWYLYNWIKRDKKDNWLNY